MSEKFYGKYRAIVCDNKDPENMGRIKVQCPKVLGDYQSGWCLPCTPMAMDDGGFLYIPSVNEIVWVEFEEGNPSKPIYTGGWWIPNRSPVQKNKNVEDRIMIVSRSQCIIEFDDKNKTITLKTPDGTFVKLGGGKVDVNGTKF